MFVPGVDGSQFRDSPTDSILGSTVVGKLRFHRLAAPRRPCGDAQGLEGSLGKIFEQRLSQLSQLLGLLCPVWRDTTQGEHLLRRAIYVQIAFKDNFRLYGHIRFNTIAAGLHR